MPDQPGRLVLFGSGETAASGRRVFDEIFRQLPQPARVAILETPAGFEPNSAAVAGNIAEFLRLRLQNYSLDISIVPARRRDTAFSPDDPTLAESVLAADCIVLGPGSPTYAVRQLRDSVVWDAVRLRFATGATLVLASAAVLAVSAHTLPVYEIYKAGADLSWERGLDLLGPAGFELAFIPHWNNREGGVDLDTSRCFMGAERFAALEALLSEQTTIVGIDEHTSLIVEPAAAAGRIVGQGAVSLVRGGETLRYNHGDTVEVGQLGGSDWAALSSDVPSDLHQRMSEASQRRQPAFVQNDPVPAEVRALVERREEARLRRDWNKADALRDELAAHGFLVRDTPDGPDLQPNGSQ